MKRVSHYVIAIPILTLCVAGCGTSAANDPTAVNDTMRSACQPFGMADPAIRSLLITTQNDKDIGITKQQEFQGLSQACSTPECLTCGIAAIDQIYGQ